MTRNPPGRVVPELDDDYIPMASQHSAQPTPAHLSHQKPVVQNMYADQHPQVQKAAHHYESVRMQQNPSYGQLGGASHAVQQSVRPPPLPPKPTPRATANGPQRPPAVLGVRFSQQPPRARRATMGNAENILAPRSPAGGSAHSQPRPLPTPPALTDARALGSDGLHYIHAPNSKEQIHHPSTRASDAEFKLKEREMELSQCNAELSKVRQCLLNKKEELKQINTNFQRLSSDYEKLQQQTSGRCQQPQVAHTEVALQVQVQHQKRVADDLRLQLERLRLQPQPAPALVPLHPAAAVDVQELQRLRDEVHRYREERQRMREENKALTLAKGMLVDQVSTYEQDFKSERDDRVRGVAKMERMQGEIDNLNQIVRMLGGEQQPP